MAHLGDFEEAKGCLPACEPAGWLIETVDNDGNVEHVGYVRVVTDATRLIPLILDIASQGRGYKPTMRTTPLYRLSDTNVLIRELVAALDQAQTALANFCAVTDYQEDIQTTLARGNAAMETGETVLARAKEMGYEP